jgi:hypothetical protein
MGWQGCGLYACSVLFKGRVVGLAYKDRLLGLNFLGIGSWCVEVAVNSGPEHFPTAVGWRSKSARIDLQVIYTFMIFKL